MSDPIEFACGSKDCVFGFRGGMAPDGCQCLAEVGYGGGDEHNRRVRRGMLAMTAEVRRLRAEVESRKELLREADDLLCIAITCANKLVTMYHRGETCRRNELDRMVAAVERFSPVIKAIREWHWPRKEPVPEPPSEEER